MVMKEFLEINTNDLHNSVNRRGRGKSPISHKVDKKPAR